MPAAGSAAASTRSMLDRSRQPLEWHDQLLGGSPERAVGQDSPDVFTDRDVVHAGADLRDRTGEVDPGA